MSVEAQYREACRARSDAEFVSKLGGALQELDESSYWMELLVEASIVPQAKLESLLDEANQLIAILTTCAKSAKATKDGPP